MKCWCVHTARGGAMATPLSSPFAPTTILRSPLRHSALLLPFPSHAASSGEDTAEAAADQEGSTTTTTATADDDFEERVLRIKSHVEPKKHGARKKKARASASANAVTLPPVQLREPRSVLGAPVEFGSTAYTSGRGGREGVGERGLFELVVKRRAVGEVPRGGHQVGHLPRRPLLRSQRHRESCPVAPAQRGVRHWPRIRSRGLEVGIASEPWSEGVKPSRPRFGFELGQPNCNFY
ncbi:LOW QUALITY PROTEIN: hypothetical protein SETIT_9G066300v2 [Setaria italica]|uniref:Uncharacterized protein n=1 Tax=Setaria italica TaxID=4555 RepID=A0A368SDS5_SETIT|nr:LOW QUALITY PROTEIN: hypothetical protein SETIT_9G066300v2 [Setaria italica]